MRWRRGRLERAASRRRFPVLALGQFDLEHALRIIGEMSWASAQEFATVLDARRKLPQQGGNDAALDGDAIGLRMP
jgi:hypothetical protein